MQTCNTAGATAARPGHATVSTVHTAHQEPSQCHRLNAILAQHKVQVCAGKPTQAGLPLDHHISACRGHLLTDCPTPLAGLEGSTTLDTAPGARTAPAAAQSAAQQAMLAVPEDATVSHLSTSGASVLWHLPLILCHLFFLKAAGPAGS
jgi:hypothetical protein